jgi:hypothetical protein
MSMSASGGQVHPARASAVVCATILCVLALGGACSDFRTPFDPASGLPDVVVDNPSFSRDVIPILEKRCSIGGCHSPATAQGGLVLTPDRAYDDLVGVPARLASGINRVTPGAPDDSFLVRVLSSDPEVRLGFVRMPLASAPLTPNQIATIANWVREGAARN